MRKIAVIAAVAAASFLGIRTSAQNVQTGPIVIQAVQHDVSPPLRDLAPGQEVAGDQARERPLRLFRPAGPTKNQADPVLQSTVSTNSSITPGTSFAGVGQGDYGFTDYYAPPDTNGSVGATQYVQWVNASFAVFDKSTHALLYGPAAGNTLWSGFGGGCQNYNDGDPVAMWDKAAQRWVMTQFSIHTTPYLQCVAVSATSDATGAWYRYAFQMSNFPDYPKLGVWPDAYYMSFNMFNGTNNQFLGSQVCALNRSAMLSGAAATAQCFQLSSAYGGLLPSDLDGSTAPPAGSPNFFVAFGYNDLQLWKFHVDWTNSANTTLTGPTNIAVASFNEACGGGTCIPQLGSSQQLDSLGDRLMFRLAYRNFGDHESLVVNHSVTAGTSVGVRWYELRSPNGTPTVYQQGTYAPDSNYRWMGSVAMDGSGDIALGYSESSSGIYPEVAYTGRLASDPLGTLQAETIVQMGAGSQQPTLSRWGDYSAMSIDPVDDCTFWYTNEYLKTSGTFNWSTIIGTFKMSGCGTTASPDFSISASPASVSVNAGGTAGSSTITVTSLNGFASSVGLTVACPSGLTCTMNPTSVTPASGGTATSALSVSASSTLAAGTYTATVTGTSGTLTHSTSVSVTVTAPDFTISASPTSFSVNQGQSGTSTISVTAVNGFTGSVSLGATGCPTGATCSFSASPIGPGSGSTLTVATTGSTPGGTYTVTVTGTSGTLTHSTSVSVTVVAPAASFTLGASPTSLTVKRGSNGSTTVTVTGTNGFNGSVSFSVSGLGRGTSASFNPTTVAASGSTTLTFKANKKAQTGTFTVTITGSSSGVSPSPTTTVSLTIQ
jgi:hypothetical protein